MVLKLDDTRHRGLAGLLAEQAAVVSVRQLHTLGVTESWVRARLRSGAWQRGYPGTYVAHNGAMTFTTRIWSALLYAGEGAMASYHTAAWLHRLEEDSSRIVHVTIPSRRRVADQPDLVVHLNGRASAQEQLGSVPPRTNVEETVLDIASSQTRADAVVGVLTNACQRNLTTQSRLIAAAALRKKLRWRALLGEVLSAKADGVESVLEWRYLQDVERAHVLPTAQRQMRTTRDGHHEYRDVGYEEFGLLIELDGSAHHSGNQVVRDMARDNAAAARDQLTLRYGWRDVTLTPCEVAAQVAAVLRHRGWTGAIKRCRRCPPPPSFR